MSTVATAAALVAAGIAGGWYSDRNPAFGLWWYGVNAIVCAVLAVIYALHRSLSGAIWLAMCAVLNGIWWNHCRRRRRRRGKLAAMGAKSRARLAAVAAKHRSAQRRTRPVLRPQPGGAA